MKGYLGVGWTILAQVMIIRLGRLALLMCAMPAISCEARQKTTIPKAVLESVDTQSCLPTLPIPNRPPFAIRVDRVADGSLRVHLQQLPNAQPPPPFDVTVDRADLHLIVAPKELFEGTTFCDVVVRIMDAPAAVSKLLVEQRDPSTQRVTSLGSSPIAVP